jgi:hypothetical protein
MTRTCCYRLSPRLGAIIIATIGLIVGTSFVASGVAISNKLGEFTLAILMDDHKLMSTERWQTFAIWKTCLVPPCLRLPLPGILLHMRVRTRLYNESPRQILIMPSFCCRLIGTITKRRKQVSFFFSTLIAHVPVAIGSGIFFLYKLFHLKSSSGGDTCIWAGNGQVSKPRCDQALDIATGLSVALLIMVWMIEICTCNQPNIYRCRDLIFSLSYHNLDGCFVVNSYAAQLREEDEKAEESNPYA